MCWSPDQALGRAINDGDPAKYELAGSHLVAGVTSPDWPASAAGSLRPVTGEAGGSGRQLQDLVYCPVDAARYRVRTSIFTPCNRGSQEVDLIPTLLVQ